MGVIYDSFETIYVLVVRILGLSFAATGLSVIIIGIPFVQLMSIEPPRGVTYYYHETSLTYRFYFGGMAFLIASAFTTPSLRDRLMEAWGEITPTLDEPVVSHTESTFFISHTRVTYLGVFVAMVGLTIINTDILQLAY